MRGFLTCPRVAASAGRGDTVTRRHGGKAKTGEEGFVLLLIFAMAAAVAIMLYMELPRVSFEAQRNREQLLIERGEQYKRAIQLYFRKFKTYPASIEQLENTNNVRFLRRRYADPLTGKNEWRLIHIGPGGVFTDSITRKPKKDQKKEEAITSQLMEAPAIGSAPADTQRASGAPPRRASEGGQPQPGGDFAAGAGGFVGQPGTGQGGTPAPRGISAQPSPPAALQAQASPAGQPWPGAQAPAPSALAGSAAVAGTGVSWCAWESVQPRWAAAGLNARWPAPAAESGAIRTPWRKPQHGGR